MRAWRLRLQIAVLVVGIGAFVFWLVRESASEQPLPSPGLRVTESGNTPSLGVRDPVPDVPLRIAIRSTGSGGDYALPAASVVVTSEASGWSEERRLVGESTSEGLVEFGPIPGGSYQVRVRARGHLSETMPVRINDKMYTERPLVVSLRRTATLRLAVQSKNGRAVEGCEVAIVYPRETGSVPSELHPEDWIACSDWKGTTGPDGQAVLSSIVPGHPFRVSALHEELGRYEEVFEELVAGENGELSITLVPPTTVTCRLPSSHDLTGARATAWIHSVVSRGQGKSGELLVDASGDGVFTFRHVKPGEKFVSALVKTHDTAHSYSVFGIAFEGKTVDLGVLKTGDSSFSVFVEADDSAVVPAFATAIIHLVPKGTADPSTVLPISTVLRVGAKVEFLGLPEGQLSLCAVSVDAALLPVAGYRSINLDLRLAAGRSAGHHVLRFRTHAPQLRPSINVSWAPPRGVVPSECRACPSLVDREGATMAAALQPLPSGVLRTTFPGPTVQECRVVLVAHSWWAERSVTVGESDAALHFDVDDWKKARLVRGLVVDSAGEPRKGAQIMVTTTVEDFRSSLSHRFRQLESDEKGHFLLYVPPALEFFAYVATPQGWADAVRVQSGSAPTTVTLRSD